MTKAEELFVSQQIAVIRWNEQMQQKALLGTVPFRYGPRGMVNGAVTRTTYRVGVPNTEAAMRYKRNQRRAFEAAVRVAQIPKEVLIRAAAECSPI